jgi:hypothetical protein
MMKVNKKESKPTLGAFSCSDPSYPELGHWPLLLPGVAIVL